MHKFYTPLYDASIYLQQPEQNAGRDTILEVGKVYYGDIRDVYRILLKFNITSISQSFASQEITGSWKAYLNMYAANSDGIPLEYTIYANAVSQSWTMGTGTKFDNISTDGVSWKYRDGVNKWQDNTIGGSAVFTPGTTGSANAEGGTWYTASQAFQSYNYEFDDVRMDVTGIVNLWISGSLPNHGFIIRHGLQNEEDLKDYGSLKFFSKESDTIYEPKLEIVWDDSKFITGSLTPITGSYQSDIFENTKVIFTNLKKDYLLNSKTRIRLKGRDIYPQKSFSSKYEYEQNKYLPTSSYYQIEDYITQDIIVPFGDYSKISCDNVSNYFYLDTTNYIPNRTYKLKVKITIDGVSEIIDEKNIFQIVDR